MCDAACITVVPSGLDCGRTMNENKKINCLSTTYIGKGMTFRRLASSDHKIKSNKRTSTLDIYIGVPFVNFTQFHTPPQRPIVKTAMKDIPANVSKRRCEGM